MNTLLSAAAVLPSRFNRAAALLAGAVLALGSGAASALETTFVGYSDGCFGLACVPPGAPGAQTIQLGTTGLSYNNSTFNATTSGGFLSIGSTGAATPGGNLDNLGSFVLTGDPFDYVGNNFDLLVTFTAPPGTAPGTALFIDKISGSVTTNDVGGIFLNFDNTPQHFTFTGGSFDFFVNDVSLTAGHLISVSGTILSQVTAVPEPETYALFMAGLAAVGFMARRRKS